MQTRSPYWVFSKLLFHCPSFSHEFLLLLHAQLNIETWWHHRLAWAEKIQKWKKKILTNELTLVKINTAGVVTVCIATHSCTYIITEKSALWDIYWLSINKLTGEIISTNFDLVYEFSYHCQTNDKDYERGNALPSHLQI